MFYKNVACNLEYSHEGHSNPDGFSGEVYQHGTGNNADLNKIFQKIE